MESIRLEQHHKSKLLEMCKALFPEYTCWGFSGHMAKAIQFKEIKTDNWEAIQWFEFCFIYLSEAIQHALPEEKIWSIMPPYAGGDGVRRWTMWSKFHYLYPKACKGFSSDGEYDLPSNPVEYLYEQFKALKT